MNSFIESWEKDQNYTFTENGAVTPESTLSANLDFFSRISAMRKEPEDRIISLWEKAWHENPTLALRNLFYSRDIRGGQGERRVFRVILKQIAKNAQFLGWRYYEAVMNNIVQYIALYGRWDDMFSLFEDTILFNKIAEKLKAKLEAEEAGREDVSLLAKWMPSANTSSQKTKELAKRFYTYFQWSPKRYRKVLSGLRKKIHLLETDMSNNNWHEIQYDKIPSQAGIKHQKAFFRHDEERYREFLEAVNSGEKKINTKTLYPYQIVEKAMVDRLDQNSKLALDTMWKNLPDYVREDDSALVVCDTSGSMSMWGDPIYVAISLAMYFGERAKNKFKDHFITFSDRPKMQKIVGSNIFDKVKNLSRADWDRNTDLEAVFRLILKTGTQNEIPQSEMPNKLYIISDMEFDSCTMNSNKSNFKNFKKMYEESGYEMPLLVFWNVNSRNDQSPVTKDERGVVLISGASPSAMKFGMDTSTTPEQFMLDVLNTERYSNIEWNL